MVHDGTFSLSSVCNAAGDSVHSRLSTHSLSTAGCAVELSGELSESDSE